MAWLIIIYRHQLNAKQALLQATTRLFLLTSMPLDLGQRWFMSKRHKAHSHEFETPKGNIKTGMFQPSTRQTS